MSIDTTNEQLATDNGKLCNSLLCMIYSTYKGSNSVLLDRCTGIGNLLMGHAESDRL